MAALVCLAVPTRAWERTGFLALPLALLLLVLVLIPGIGHTVNGSTRWLNIGGVNLIQVSEPARLLMLMYLSGYAVRHRADLRDRFFGFAKPMLLVVLVCVLLLLEPDFGAAVVLLAISMAVLFVAGARIRDFLITVVGVGAAMALLAVTSPYRLQRLLGFRDPWADPLGSGYQLTQSLIAIGSGQWFGVGLGGSVQKLFYLPEAHTDFVFSIWAEETGFVGTVLVIGLYVALIGRVLWTGRRVGQQGNLFGAHICYGAALIFSGQAFVNMGVSSGLLPTKGLTLPFISYGGSSLIACCCLLALVLRTDRETRPVRGGVKK